MIFTMPGVPFLYLYSLSYLNIITNFINIGMCYL